MTDEINISNGYTTIASSSTGIVFGHTTTANSNTYYTIAGGGTGAVTGAASWVYPEYKNPEPTVEYDIEFERGDSIEASAGNGGNVNLRIKHHGASIKMSIPTNPDRIREICEELERIARVMESVDTAEVMINGAK